MSGFIAQQLRSLQKDLVRAHRKLAMADLEGSVVAQNVEAGTIQLLLGTDPTSGAPVLSPWIKPQLLANQPGFKLAAPLPPVGTHMRMISPSGVVGAASYAAPSYADAGQPGPNQAPAQAVIAFGQTTVTIADGAFSLAIGGKGFSLGPSGLQMTSKFTAEGGATPVDGNSNLLS